MSKTPASTLPVALAELPQDLAASFSTALAEPSALQRQLLEDRALLGHDDLLIAGPAGAGKGALAELALVRAVRGGARALIVTADDRAARALAQELVARRHKLAPRRRKTLVVRCATLEQGGDDRAILSGEFNVAVTTHQRARNLLVRSPALIDAIGVLVIDDLERLVDDGDDLEILLTRRALAERRPRLLGLWQTGSAGSLAAARLLAARVGATLLSSDAGDDGEATLGEPRPVEPLLLHLVACGLAATSDDLRRAALTSPRRRDGGLDVERSLTRLRAVGLVAPGRVLACTRAGRSAAILGLDHETALYMVRTVSDLAAPPLAQLELLAGLCATPMGLRACAALTVGDDASLRRALLRRAESLQLERRPIFRWLVEDLAALEASTTRAMAAALVLDEALCDGRDEAARRHGLPREALDAQARALAWLAAALREIALCCPCSRARRERCDLLARALDPAAIDELAGLLRLEAPRSPAGPTRRLRRPPTHADKPQAPPQTQPVAGASTTAPPRRKTPRWSPFGVIYTL
ncbi:MAG: DEAD/DEAH box helicase [Myxococcales bacterium]|nr:DEAD/DEAH box helicase [Myxococcales bacterium]